MNRAIVAAVTALSLLVIVGTASAQSCRAIGDSSVIASVRVGEFLAVGRTALSLTIRTRDDQPLSSDLLFTVIDSSGAAAKQQVVSSSDVLSNWDNDVEIAGVPAEGSLRIDLSWSENDLSAAPGCFTHSTIVPRQAGSDLRFGRWRSVDNDLYVSASFVRRPATCNELRVAPVSLDVVTTSQSRTVRRRLRFDDQCEAFQGRSLRFSGGEIALTGTGAVLEIKGKWKEFRYFDLVARSGQGDSKVLISAFYWPPYRVYQGTDEFWNYCLKRDRETFMHQGYLYCRHGWEIRWWIGKRVLDSSGTKIVPA